MPALWEIMLSKLEVMLPVCIFSPIFVIIFKKSIPLGAYMFMPRWGVALPIIAKFDIVSLGKVDAKLMHWPVVLVLGYFC